MRPGPDGPGKGSVSPSGIRQIGHGVPAHPLPVASATGTVPQNPRCLVEFVAPNHHDEYRYHHDEYRLSFRSSVLRSIPRIAAARLLLPSVWRSTR